MILRTVRVLVGGLFLLASLNQLGRIPPGAPEYRLGYAASTLGILALSCWILYRGLRPKHQS